MSFWDSQSISFEGKTKYIEQLKGSTKGLKHDIVWSSTHFHWLIDWPTDWLPDWLQDGVNASLTHWLTHCITHSLTQSPHDIHVIKSRTLKSFFHCILHPYTEVLLPLCRVKISAHTIMTNVVEDAVKKYFSMSMTRMRNLVEEWLQYEDG